MSKYINADELRNAMYQETFEKDSKMQKWESGCWIRYKLFENVLDAMPSADVVEAVRCKDCKYWDVADKPNRKSERRLCEMYRVYRKPTDFCSRGERKETE